MDISKGQAVEGDLNAYITRADKRRRKSEGERPVLCARDAALEIRRGAA